MSGSGSMASSRSSMAQGQGMPRASSSVGNSQSQSQSVRQVGLFSAMSRNKTMPVTRAEHEAAAPMPEWKLHCLCSEYNLPPVIKGHLGGSCF